MERCWSGRQCGLFTVKGVPTSSRVRGVERHRDQPHEVGVQGHGHQREVARGAPVFAGAHARRRGHAARRCSACVCIPPLWSRRRGGTSNGIRCGRRGGTEPSPADGPPTDFAVAPRLRVRNDAATQRDAALHAPGHDPDRVTAAVARRTASSGGVAATRSRRWPWRPGATTNISVCCT